MNAYLASAPKNETLIYLSKKANPRRTFVLVFVMLALMPGRSLCSPSGAVDPRRDGPAQASGAPITVGERIQIHSTRLGERREILVFLPPSYADSRQRYPVIYSLDGGSTGLVAASAVQFMTGASEIPQIPEALVVAIPNIDRDRDLPSPHDYGRGGEENFLAFLADELVPTIDRTYRTRPLRVLIGHSAGGLFAHYALTARPQVFQWYLSLDAPLFGPVRPILEKARTMITKDPGYRGRLVTIEESLGWGDDWPSLLENAPKGFHAARVEITDETHETLVYKGIYEGLKQLFYDFAPEAKDAKLAELEANYEALSEAYGYNVEIPQQVLLRSASRNAMQGYGVEALELVQRAVELYGESAATKRIMAEAEEAAKKGGPDPRVAELLNAPPPSVEQMKPFLGVWAGRLEVPNGAPLDVVLTLEIENGVVRGHEKITGPGGYTFEMAAQFIRVLDGQTLQWGLRNRGGIGLIVYTAKLADDKTLEGTEDAIGMPRRPGVTIPPSTFTYKRHSGAPEDPFSGVWKLNLSKSKLTPPYPKSQIVRIEVDGSRIRITEELVSATGERLSISVDARFDGKDYPVQGAPFADSVSYERVDRFTIKGIGKKDGRVVMHETVVVSADGSTQFDIPQRPNLSFPTRG